MSSKNALMKAYQSSLKLVGKARADIQLEAQLYFNSLTKLILDYENPQLTGRYLDVLAYLHEQASGKPREEILSMLERITAEESVAAEEETKIESEEYRAKKPKRKISRKISYVTLSDAGRLLKQYHINQGTPTKKLLTDGGYAYRIRAAIKQGKLRTRKKGNNILVDENKVREVFGSN